MSSPDTCYKLWRLRKFAQYCKYGRWFETLVSSNNIVLIVCWAEVRRNRSKCTASNSSQIPSKVKTKRSRTFPAMWHRLNEQRRKQPWTPHNTTACLVLNFVSIYIYQTVSPLWCLWSRQLSRDVPAMLILGVKSAMLTDATRVTICEIKIVCAISFRQVTWSAIV